MVITGPYIDYGNGKKTLTITKPIVTKNGEFIGVAAIDM